MKSNNQGFKEDTFIQTGRRGRVAETGGEAVAEQTGGIPLGQAIPAPGHTTPGSSTGKTDPSYLWL